MEKIVFFHMNQIGDFLFSLPVLYAFKKEKPEIFLISVVKKHLVPLIKLCGVVDRIIMRPSDGILESIRFVKALRKETPSAAILFSESYSSMLFSKFSNFYPRVGFKNSYSRFFLTNLVERTGVPSLSNNKKLGEFFELKQIPDTYCGLINIPSNEIARWLAQVEVLRLKADNIVILSPLGNPRRPEKIWNTDYWAAISDFLIQHGMQMVLVGAKSGIKELEKIKNNQKYSKNDKIIIYAGQSLKDVAILISRAKLFLGIDSGLVHLASALEKPMVVLYGPTDPEQIGPQHEKKIILKKNKIDAIEPNEVIENIKKIII